MSKKIMICSRCGKKVVSVFPVDISSTKLGFLCRTCRIDFFTFFIKNIYLNCGYCNKEQHFMMKKFIGGVKE
jgi:hypothetical protein